MTETEALALYDGYLRKQAQLFHRKAKRQTIPLDDLIQEARLAFLQHIRTHDESMWIACTLTIHGAFFELARRTYPLTISHNGFMEKIRTGLAFMDIDEYSETIGLEDDHSAIDLMASLSRLRADEKKIIALLLEGYTVTEIGKKMNMSHQVISYRVKRIREKIKSFS